MIIFVLVSIVLFTVLVPARAQQADFEALQIGLYGPFRYCVNDRVDEPLCDVIIAHTPVTPLFYRQHAPRENDISIEEKRAVIKKVADELMGRQ